MRSTAPTFRHRLAAGALAALVLFPLACSSGGGGDASQPANILFIVMDDVGVDQMQSFGYGGATPAALPNLDRIARNGVRFHNTWSMPECSPSRAMLFQGRYPFRSGVENALADSDLANSQVSPFTRTTPRVLAERGYTSALFGKYHLGGPTWNPYEYGTPRSAGFDYFYGFLEGEPDPIDTTAGGAGEEDAYPCGFVPDASQDGGADGGACYLAVDGPCTELALEEDGLAPGLRCLQSGGIFDPGATCQASAPANLSFDAANGYYVSPIVINEEDGTVVEVPYSDPRARRYRTTLETDAAIGWINARDPGRPWMATVAYSSMHTPYQQPPMELLPDGTTANGSLDCDDSADQRTLADQMLEALDDEVGRLLVETGIATRGEDGSVVYDPAASNTWVVVIGDNGSYLTVVKAPFDPQRAKATVYQTGVWVPFFVAGPGVVAPDRTVSAMLNLADLFALFAEIAGVDLAQDLPSWYRIDAQPVMPYLTDPDQPSLRTSNLTYSGSNVKDPDAPASPCVVPVGDGQICTESLPTKGSCEVQGGVWYGAGADVDTSACGSDGCATCCDVQLDYISDLELLPAVSTALRNDDYKLVENQIPDCTADGALVTSYEFYRIDEDVPVPLLDREDDDLLTSPDLPPEGLDDEQEAVFYALYDELASLLASEVDCPGDGNEDLVVDQQDLDEWHTFSELTGEANSSWYDFNHDALTDELDRAVIEDNLGADCRAGG